MDLELLKNGSEKILDCAVKDSAGLNDFQRLPNQNQIEIPEVGIG